MKVFSGGNQNRGCPDVASLENQQSFGGVIKTIKDPWKLRPKTRLSFRD